VCICRFCGYLEESKRGGLSHDCMIIPLSIVYVRKIALEFERSIVADSWGIPTVRRHERLGNLTEYPRLRYAFEIHDPHYACEFMSEPRLQYMPAGILKLDRSSRKASAIPSALHLRI